MKTNRKYDLPDLPATNDKKAQRLWNPDGQAFQQQIPMNRPKLPTPQCGQIKVINGCLVCHACKHPHTLPIQDIDGFIEANKDLMMPLAK